MSTTFFYDKIFSLWNVSKHEDGEAPWAIASSAVTTTTATNRQYLPAPNRHVRRRSLAGGRPTIAHYRPPTSRNLCRLRRAAQTQWHCPSKHSAKPRGSDSQAAKFMAPTDQSWVPIVFLDLPFFIFQNLFYFAIVNYREFLGSCFLVDFILKKMKIKLIHIRPCKSPPRCIIDYVIY